MNTIKITAILLILAFLLPTATTAEEKDTPIIKQVFNGPYYMQREPNRALVTIPVTLGKDLKPGDIALHVSKVVYDDQERGSLLSQFHVELLEADKNNPLRLWVAMNYNGRGKRFGDYTIQLGIAAGEKSELLQLVLKYPNAELKAIAPLKIQQTKFFGISWFGLDRISRQTLYLQIKDGKAVQEPFVYQAGSATSNGVQVEGRLGFESPVLRDQGRISEIPMTIENPFPLGASEGKIAILSPDFQDTEVAFTVTTKWNSLLIFIIAFIAIILGYLLRVELASRLTKKKNMLQLTEFLQQVRKARQKGKQKEFQVSIDKLEEDILQRLDALRLATGATDEEALKTLFQSYQTRLTEALQQYETARQTLDAETAKWLDVLSRYRELPPVLETIVLSAGKQLQQVNGHLDGKDLDAASQVLDLLPRNLGRELLQAFTSWYNEIDNRWRQLGEELPYRLPEPVAVMLNQQLTQLLQHCQDHTPGNTVFQPETIETFLNSINDMYREATGMVKKVTEALIDTANDVLGVLSKKLVPDEGQHFLNKLEISRNRLREYSGHKVIDDPAETMPSLGQRIIAVTGSLFQAIEYIASTSSEDNRKEVIECLEDGKYLEAATHISQPQQPPVTLEVNRDSILGSLDIPEERKTKAKAILPLAPSFSEKPVSAVYQTIAKMFRHSGSIDREAQQFSPLEAPRTMKNIRRDIHRAKWLQSLISGFGLAIVGWFIFQGTFTGTPNDLLSVFLWGFTTDLVVNTFVERQKKS